MRAVQADYFRDCLLADIDSLAFYAGIHEKAYGYHRMRAKTFPFTIYYKLVENEVTVVAVLDARRDPSWIRERLSQSTICPNRVAGSSVHGQLSLATLLPVFRQPSNESTAN
jgi:plasmid stabilization system protein ParE